MRRFTAVAAAVAVALLAQVVAPGVAHAQQVLLISLPATSWGDVQAGDDPNLQRLFEQSAVADMITRTAGRKSSISAGYTALGAGGRASANSLLAAQAFEVDEPYGDSTAGARTPTWAVARATIVSPRTSQTRVLVVPTSAQTAG